MILGVIVFAVFLVLSLPDSIGLWLDARHVSILGFGALALLPYFASIVIGRVVDIKRLPGFVVGVVVSEICLSIVHAWSISGLEASYLFGPFIDELIGISMWTGVAIMMFLLGFGTKFVALYLKAGHDANPSS